MMLFRKTIVRNVIDKPVFLADELTSTWDVILAKIRVGAPEPPLIFTGNANTSNPLGGSLSRFATFSIPGTPAPNKTWCVLNSVTSDPWSKEGASRPKSLIFLLSINHFAASLCSPKKERTEKIVRAIYWKVMGRVTNFVSTTIRCTSQYWTHVFKVHRIVF